MPFPLCELSPLVAFRFGHLGLAPAAVLFGAKSCQPEPFHEVTGLGVNVLHVPLKEIRQHLLVGFLRVPMNGLAPHGEDGTGLEAD